jgi:hypothetical protein
MYTQVTRKAVGEDRIAICPKFGCEIIKKIKPLKFGFIGFGKNPKCKRHNIPLVYVDERIGEFVDGALACLFDIAGLPPKELLLLINSKFSDNLEPFIQGWIYCIVIGRGAPIISQYIDSISKAYLKQLTRKQIKVLINPTHSKDKSVNQKVIEGMQEITKQYTRLLKHLRTHSEIISDVKKLNPLSDTLRSVLLAWQNISLKEEDLILKRTYQHNPLSEIKKNFDYILNIGTCRCLLGLAPEGRKLKNKPVTPFDRFSAYYEFYIEGLTKKFTKLDIEKILNRNPVTSPNPFNNGEDVEIKERYSINNINKGASDVKINANELILIINADSKSNELVELSNIQINNNSQVLGLDISDQLREIGVYEIITTKGISFNIICKHGTLALTENNSLYTVDDDLNFIKIPAKNVHEGMPILMPRVIHVVEDHSPLDFSSCGEVIEENGIQYVKKARTKVFRFVEKNFDLGYILGQYCAEGSMNVVSISCGNDKSEMEKVANLVEKTFGYKPFFGRSNKEQYKTVYSVESNTILIKSIFTQGLGLEVKHAPFKEIPPFLYNAPIECVKGFIFGFAKGDGSIGEYVRKRSFQSSHSRDIDFRLFTSSRKLVFGLSFLLKRLGINAEISRREFDDDEHPTWYDAYTLRLNGNSNLNNLREFIPNLPEYGIYARDKASEIDLNVWMKRLNVELKDIFNISLRKLSENKKIPYIAARCAQQNSKMNISEGKMLETIKFLKNNGCSTPIVSKLYNIFRKHTFTRVKRVEINSEITKTYRLLTSFSSIYLVGIGHLFVN